MNKKTIFGFFAVGFLSIVCVSVVIWQLELRPTTTDTREEKTIPIPGIVSPQSRTDQVWSDSSV